MLVQTAIDNSLLEEQNFGKFICLMYQRNSIVYRMKLLRNR